MSRWRRSRFIAVAAGAALCWIVAPAAGAQVADSQVTVSVALEPEEIPFHHVARYTVTVEAPKSASVEIAPWAAEMPGLTISREPLKSEPFKAGWQRVTQTFVLTPSAERTYELPAARVVVDGTSWGGIAPRQLAVRALTPEERDAAAERMPVMTLAAALDASERYTWVWPGVIAALLVSAAAGYGWWRRGRRIAPPLPPWEQAERELQALMARLEDRTIRGETFYMTLSNILRDYVAQRFGIRVRERSTPELAQFVLDEVPLELVQAEALLGLLRCFDQVKYARRQPGPSQMKNEAGAALEFVRATAAVSERAEADWPLETAV